MHRALAPLACLLGVLVLAVPAQAVIGGRAASEDYPWMVSVRLDGGHYCGGSLVRPDWVLTAAHCVDGNEASRYSVILGRHRLSATGGEQIGVRQIVENEGYKRSTSGGYDIALLNLARPSAAKPLKLVGLDESALWAPGRPARVIGWGSSVFLVGPGSDDLMEVDVPMVSDSSCKSSYDLTLGAGGTFDPATMVCAGESTGLKDSCQGDSGGPLVTHDAAGAWAQVGTVSFGLGCGFPLFYGVYGRLGAPVMRQWLDAHLPPAPGSTAPAKPPTAPGGGTSRPSPGTSSGPPTAPPPATGPAAGPGAPKAVRLRWSVRRHGSALTIRLRVSAPVTAVTAILTRGPQRIARGMLARVRSRGVLVLHASPRALRARGLRLLVSARDRSGRSVRASGFVR